MKQSLQLKLGQQLTMTPQLQQAIRLLQLSTLDLQHEIQEALDSNPMLEASEDDFDGGDVEASSDDNAEAKTASTTEEKPAAEKVEDSYETTDNSGELEWNDDIPKDLAVDTNWDDIYQTSGPATGLARNDEDDPDYESRRGNSESLQDHLSWQLNLTPMSDRDKEIAEAIIDAVEPSGMLCQTAEEIFSGLAAHDEELELDEVLAVLHRVQQFDPPGVASQNVRECLLIQLNQFELDQTSPELKLAKNIVDQYLDVLAARDFKQLMRKLKVKEQDLQAAIAVIQGLNPRPGESIGSDSTEYVIPDVFVSKENDRWTVRLNPEIAPKLRINSGYASLVKRADTSADNTFLRDNLQEARWFLKSLQSRNETLLKVATCIVEKQQGFLDQGPEAMRPMVLHDVAETVEMHESTISRVTTQKYMHTPQGIFELKYFFSSHVATDSGGECSSTAIRAIIKKLVAAENARKPLSDSKITDILAEQGIKVARRTIAKYRESLNIPPSNERKRLV
ncbi:RNA polymerase factor sigma-54 [Saccharophagus degradans]|uniref:RNA polymerase sigma-54 factor n=1 Tax=Saccharophagus degradans (strain 2-40 / ATCC 43961 / DSM 17024) TaxID=203122 RepID=Q21FU3_SACD2|nr:RNA polymerase factor sigma-54 [Saccharophagus degradans]ABD82436.1 sigma-54, DNA-binding [Saccharophagus degradans 2-40]